MFYTGYRVTVVGLYLSQFNALSGAAVSKTHANAQLE